jgi:GNAT superfamily N-acetyltransferase
MLWRQRVGLPDDWGRRKHCLAIDNAQSDLAIQIADSNDGETLVFWDEHSDALATWTPFRRIVLSRMTPAQAGGLAQLLADQSLVGVSGHTPEVNSFTQVWLDAAPGRSRKPGKTLILHDLPALLAPRPCLGRAKACTRRDLDFVWSWALAFHHEVENGTPPPQKTNIDRGLARGTYWFWTVDDQPVSYAGLHWPSANSSRIGPVYTPPERRGSGYASALVHHLAKRGSTNARCTLFTDHTNAVSNAIYQALGFRPGPAFQEWNLTARTPETV